MIPEGGNRGEPLSHCFCRTPEGKYREGEEKRETIQAILRSVLERTKKFIKAAQKEEIVVSTKLKNLRGRRTYTI